MQTWADQLHDKLLETQQQAQQAREAEQDRKRQTYSIRCVPMAERLQNLIDAMPDDERARPRHMEFFRQLLRSKYVIRGRGNRASVSEIGPALKQLGWTRQREWLGAEQTYRTWWIPPEAQEN
ncbi:hypothetical protein [Halochromatium salexigens]|uniref:Uncharacterized protein n=1 Tax=Halochromatium salexigens TaxID=49447 RepID=A0AAJ0UCP5_HALSE|nr:hypothetical protein [Halochromatium salexigens]MBK5929095.1 hypothetical protein [Halochromatium salexigens]